MTADEADALAKRIANCWRGGPPIAEWRDELARLEHGRAGTAYVRLRRTIDHAPSIHRFIAEYGAIETDDPSADRCPQCANGGWVHAGFFEAHDGHVYSAAQPCTGCPHGRMANDSTAWRDAPRRTLLSESRAAVLTHQERTRSAGT